MSAAFTESLVETAAVGWLKAIGWRAAHGPDIGPDMPAAERANYGEVVLGARLRDALATDTSGTAGQLPLYQYPSVEALTLPRGCELVGVELVDEAIDLPSFRHPSRAAYVFGPERSSLSPAMQARCRHLVRIPTRFCVNLAIAGAIVMYDRLLVHGRFAERPVGAGGPVMPAPAHVHGRPLLRR